MNRKLKVLSLFDGISCGRIALERANLEVEKYIAYEIEENAIKVSNTNYPDIEHFGDVTTAEFSSYNNFDLLIGGSPCQNLCTASNSFKCQKPQGLDGEKSKLFFEYIRALEEANPKYFLFENVASMKNSDRDAITSYLKVDPILIDSSFVSAQTRKRYYWTNIADVIQPINKNIKLTDVMIPKNQVDSKWFHSQKAIDYMMREVGESGRKRLYNGQGVTFSNAEKSGTITANFKKGVPYNVYVYSESEMRRFTPEECEALQTLPIGYTSCISDTKRYETIGNGWNVDTIAHILSFIK